tara:strand:+ start:1642 stop:1884 length:243 start_codon:yes stop_codon:yes gene_type:complete
MTYKLSEDSQLAWLLNELRTARDLKLLKSDWTQLSDSPLSEQKKTEWANYRQQLRDLPASVNGLNEDRTITVNWPTEPTD